MIRNNKPASIVALAALVALLVAVLMLAGASGVAADDDDDLDGLALYQYNENGDGYAIVQGDECTPIEPLGDGHRTAEEYYDYRNPNTSPSSWTYSSYGTTHLQEDDTSILFLHEGSDGLSLIFVHDRLDGDTEGGAATFTITGLPEEGEWVVEDDNYDGADSEWDHRETSSRITSVWTEARTDGGAFNGGLDDEFAITITPAFNELADFQVFDGEVTDWQVVSGQDHDPDRTSLDMHEPIEIRNGGCTMVSDVEVNRTATVGDVVDVEATIVNGGDEDRTVTVPIAIDGEVVHEEEVTVNANGSTTVQSSIAFDDHGTQTVSAGAAATNVDVAASDSEGLPGFGIVVALVAILAALGLSYRRE